MIERLTFKVCMFADKDVGKKTLAKSNSLKRHFEGSPSSYMMTTGVALTTKMVEHSGKNIVLKFWIISDEKERFQHIWKQFIKGSSGVILMYDITNSRSLNYLSEFLKNVKKFGEKNPPILLVGNKLDLEEYREISKEQIENFKRNNEISESMEISLKTRENVEKMFLKITEMML